MKDSKLLVERINTTVNLAQVMQEYRIQFKHDPTITSETQYHCPFHGLDNKPSARLYKNTNSCYCWYCQKSWDVISFIMEKEGFSFYKTLNFIVDHYKVDTSDIPDGPSEYILDNNIPIISEDTIDSIYLKNRIKSIRGKIEFEKYRALCVVYYMIMHKKFKGIKCPEDIEKFKSKLNQIG